VYTGRRRDTTCTPAGGGHPRVTYSRRRTPVGNIQQGERRDGSTGTAEREEGRQYRDSRERGGTAVQGRLEEAGYIPPG